jgi:ABC-2 type transport system ATP-binding protein
MQAVRVEGLCKRFGEVQALDGLTLSVESGSVFGFLGPNGAGKTTTIRILAGLAQPDNGQAWVDGVEVTAGPASRGKVAGRIGYLPQDPAFYPWMTAREFMDYVGRVFGLPSQERQSRTENLLELAGLTAAGERRIGGFSGGMRQRLGVAQALINQPPVLFLDEPVSGLDPAGRRDLLELIDELREQCTVFMSTHILADVERVCDSVGIINHGMLVTEARKDELLEQYAVPAFEIEAEYGFEETLEEWAEKLRQTSWVTSVTRNARTARVVVNDVERAKRELMTAAVGAGLVLRRYEMVRPSLEDVFLQLVGEGGS